MLSISCDALRDFLKQHNIEVVHQDIPNQIASHLAVGKDVYPFFVKIDQENGLVQLIVFMPYALPKNTVTDIARLLHFYNKEIDLPGFGMDEEGGTLFYRYSVVGEEGKVSENILTKIIAALPKICEAFFPLLTMAMAGKLNFDSALEKAKRRKK